jgi:bacteriophage N4 adsorption protein B
LHGAGISDTYRVLLAGGYDARGQWGALPMDAEALLPLAPQLHWLSLLERELFLFAAFWLVLGALDELAVDLAWLWLRATGRIPTRRADPPPPRLSGHTAVFVAAWDEAAILATTLTQVSLAWPQPELRLFVGVYRNDPATFAAACRGAAHDPRIRIVVHDRPGPTTKADCLNGLYRALEREETRHGLVFRTVILQDAEDMVHPAAIGVIDRAIGKNAMVQLPVRPVLPDGPRFVSGHYADEFSENHTKNMAVRDAFGLVIPSAGVGCAIERRMLEHLVPRGVDGPFSPDSLTEDYELGFRIARVGGRSRFIRMRDGGGQLIATSSYFPDALGSSARQKARWIHGIAFQSWDRLGWSGSWANRWMLLRDRRAPLAALVLTIAYVLLAIEAVLIASDMPVGGFVRADSWIWICAVFLMFSILWRSVWRAAFVAREYGWCEAGFAVLRIPVANVIGIMAGWRALAAYCGNLRGAALRWDKTTHAAHPAAGVRLGSPT